MENDKEMSMETNVDGQASSLLSEEYAYLDRGGFSSENFKIELRGLPKFYGIAVSFVCFLNI